jgi:hypothetical protein
MIRSHRISILKPSTALLLLLVISRHWFVFIYGIRALRADSRFNSVLQEPTALSSLSVPKALVCCAPTRQPPRGSVRLNRRVIGVRMTTRFSRLVPGSTCREHLTHPPRLCTFWAVVYTDVRTLKISCCLTCPPPLSENYCPLNFLIHRAELYYKSRVYKSILENKI